MKTKKAKVAARFAELVAERVALEKKWRKQSTLAALKLTAEAYLSKAMLIAETTPERVAALRKKLETPDAFGVTEITGCLRRMVAAVSTPNMPGPPRELRRWSYCLTPGAVAELAALSSTTLELAALAVLVCTELHPETFGKNTSIEDHQRALMELRLRMDALDAQIPEAITAADMEIGEADNAGNARVTFKISSGVVPLGPKHNAAERLTNWMLSQEQKALS